MAEYLSPQQAWEQYGLQTDTQTKETDIERQLRENGIAAIEMPLSPDEFKRFSEGFAIALNECPSELQKTFHKADTRYGGEAGYTRKETKFDQSTGYQVADPKNYFHFTESARTRWREQFSHGSKAMRDFLEDGFEIHDALIGVAKETVKQLDGTHGNMSKLYFPDDESFSFLRLLRYDGYQPHDKMVDVATPHFDIGGVTVQAYADAPGFWAAKGGEVAARQHYDTNDREAYAFLGKGHERVYGTSDELKPLYHGVDRIIPAGVTWVPERTAVILFVDAPQVDYEVREHDTRPYLANKIAQLAFA